MVWRVLIGVRTPHGVDIDDPWTSGIRSQITILKTNTPYPSRKIRRIRACTHQRPQRKEDQYAVSRRSQYAILKMWMDDPNITMEEYIRLEEEKARKRGKVFNWETAKYGKIWYDEDIHDLRSIETEFPAIDFTCEPTVSSLNDEIDFRVLFDDSDDEDYTYTKADIADFESRLARIYQREVHRVQVFDFGGLPDLMAEGLSARMLMEHRDAQGQSVFTSRAWRRFFDIRGPLVHKLILEFFSTFRFGEAMTDLDTAGALQLLDSMLTRPRARDRSSIRVDMMDMDRMLVCWRIYLALAQSSLRSGSYIRLFSWFVLLGLTVIAPALLVIDMAELVRLQICEQLDDTWAWVAIGPERQPDAAAGAPGVAQDAPVIDEGGQADPAPVQAPPPPPAAARTMP
ncbi:hypothetical protein Tco_0394379 [Tanacetum coccineum]